MLLSPNKVFCLEPRPCEMTPPPGVVPGDCLSVCVHYTHNPCECVCAVQGETMLDSSTKENSRVEYNERNIEVTTRVKYRESVFRKLYGYEEMHC